MFIPLLFVIVVFVCIGCLKYIVVVVRAFYLFMFVYFAFSLFLFVCCNFVLFALLLRPLWCGFLPFHSATFLLDIADEIR